MKTAKQRPIVRLTKKLNIGSGTFLLDGYVNIDVAAAPYKEIIMDANALAFKDEVFDEVLSDSCLITVEELKEAAVAEAFRVLRSGGKCSLWVYGYELEDAKRIASSFGEIINVELKNDAFGLTEYEVTLIKYKGAAVAPGGDVL